MRASTNNFEPNKTSFKAMRNQKSVKMLNIHLKEYSQNKYLQTRHRKQSQNNLNEPQNLFPVKLQFDKKYDEKCLALVDNIILNLSIFKKVFITSRKKRMIIQKLYGWDSIFGTIFFDDNELKANLKRDQIIRQLHLDKKNFNSKNTYNKLRFFLAQLIALNNKQQQLESKYKKNRLSESCTKLLGDLQRYSEESKKKENKRYIQMMRSTHLDLLNMKMKIKNKGNDLKKISEGTGRVRMDPFFLNEQKNIHYVESFAKQSLIK